MKNEPIIECPLCGSDAYLKQKEYPGYQEPDTFNIYYCPDCKTAFSNPRVDATPIYESIYKNVDSVPGYDRYAKYAKKVKYIANPLKFLAESEDTYWAVNEAISLYVSDKNSSKILEIGSGLGYLTYSLINDGYDTIGMDISKSAVDQANKLFGNYYICADLFEYAKNNPATYDIIILTEVIEHVEKPLNFIKSIMELLKPDGRAIISTPNKSLCPLDIHWFTEAPPVHYWWFSEDSMKFIANRVNANISFVNFTEYYKKNSLLFNIKELRKNIPRQPILNSKGEVIATTKVKLSILYLCIYFLIDKIPRLKERYVKLKRFFNPSIIICNEKGIVLCGILQKKLND